MFRQKPRRVLQSWPIALFGLCALSATSASAQIPLPVLAQSPQPSPPATTETQADGPAFPAMNTPYPPEPVTLQTILRLAAASNLDIARAASAVEQARANRQKAIAQVLPTLTIGSTYTTHEGRIQQANGNILTINRDSLFTGGGSTLVVSLSDALYAPLVARQLETASEAGFHRISNETLFQVGDMYLTILRLHRRLARIDDTLDFLTSETASELRGKSKGLLPLIKDSVELGGKEALQSDLARIQVEVIRRQEERATTVQDIRIASGHLARMLRLDPRITFWPIEDIRVPMPMNGEDWIEQEMDVLVALALGSRPDLSEHQALVQATVERVRQARYRPYLPYVVSNLSYGGFGGSPLRDTRRKFNDPLNGPIDFPITTSGVIGNFGPRTEADISLVWRLNGLGFGNAAELREQRAIRDQAELRLLQVQDAVVHQVMAAYGSVRRSRERLGIARTALYDDKGQPTGAGFRSIRLNFERIRGAEGRPFEVLDSIRSFGDIVEVFGQAVSDNERAKLRLLIALGLPPQAYFDAAIMPPAPASAGRK